jgi:hypothetical protein
MVVLMGLMALAGSCLMADGRRLQALMAQDWAILFSGQEKMWPSPPTTGISHLASRIP